MTTTRYLDAVTLLHSNGHPHLASAAIAHYERLASGMSAEGRCRVSAMFDEVLGMALRRREEITAEETLLSPDFVVIRAVARVLQDLKLVEVVTEISDQDLVQAPEDRFEIIDAELDDEPIVSSIFTPGRSPPSRHCP